MQTGKLVRVLLFALLAALLVACGGAAPGGDVAPPAEPTSTPVSLSGEAVIYVVAPLSGAQAQQGQAQAAGARLAASILNEQGGLLGREIVIRTVNDRGTVQASLNAAEDIAAEAGDNVVGIITSESSDPQMQAVREVYLNNVLPTDPLVVVPASTNPLANTIAHPHYFRLSAPSVSQASEIAAALRESNVNDVVVLHSPTEASQLLGEQFQAAAGELDITLVDTLEISPDDTDFAEAAQRIFDQNPSALFLATNPFESGEILSALYDINYQGSIYAADQALPYAVVDELGCQAEGLFRSSVIPSPQTVMTTAQFQRYEDNEGRAAEPFSVAGYAAVEFITEAYRGARDVDASAAAEYAQNNTITTLLGELDFGASGSERVGATMHFQQVQGRTFRDEFQRVAGTVPESNESSTASIGTFLDLTFPEDREPIVFADLNWNSALFHNAVARIIVEAGYGYPTQAVPGSTVPSFQRLSRGEVDVLIENYNVDASVIEALESGQIIDLGVNFTDAVQGWFVPRYVVDADNPQGLEPVAPDLRSVDQLEQYVSTFTTGTQRGTGALYGGVPGWQAHKINCLKLKAYRLDDNYAQVTSESTADLFGSLAQAYDSGEPILLYLWAPTSVFGRYDLVQLEEPAYSESCWQTDRGCAYPTGDVNILVHGELPEIAPDVSAFLQDFNMDIGDVSDVLVRIEDENLTPDEAAVLWMQENEAVWSQWVPEDVAAQVEESLAQAES